MLVINVIDRVQTELESAVVFRQTKIETLRVWTDYRKCNTMSASGHEQSTKDGMLHKLPRRCVRVSSSRRS